MTEPSARPALLRRLARQVAERGWPWWAAKAGRWAGWLVAALALLAFVPQLAEQRQVLERMVYPPPIDVLGQSVRWDGPMDPVSVSEGSIWRYTCARVTISRMVQLDDGSAIPVMIEPVSGSIASTSPRFNLSTRPERRGGVVARVVFPDWFKEPWRVRYYILSGFVPAETPCEGGWFGTWRIVATVVPPWPYTLPRD